MTVAGCRPIRIPLGAIDHDCRSAVILFEVNPAGIAVLEFKRDPPRPIHMDRIARGLKASQGMEIKAGDIHFLGHRSGIQAIQTTKDRACIFASSFAARPFSQSSARALLLKLLIIV